MGFDDFLETVKKNVEDALGAACTVSFSRVRKNNGVYFHGIVIRRGEASICPSIYLDPYYEELLEGRDMEHIIQEVLAQYRNAMRQELSGKIDLSYEHVKRNIVYRLVNGGKNEALLQECPTTEFLDLLVTYHIVVHGISEKEQASIRITKEMMEMWGVDLKELSEIAEENTKRLLPPLLCSMREMLGRLMLEEEQRKELAESLGEGESCQAGDLEELTLKMTSGQPEMYILTNEKSLYGAAAVLYRDLIPEFAGKLRSDLYLLPGSVHEFILLPAVPGMSKEKLAEMVQEVNHTKLSQEEFLSDFIYYYCRREDRFQRL